MKEPRNRFQGIDSASIFSLAGRYDNPGIFLNVYKFGLRMVTKIKEEESDSCDKVEKVFDDV